MSAEPEPDEPVPFGYKSAWFALRTAHAADAADALGLGEPRPCGWADGVGAAYDNKVFLTPPVKGWTLAVSRIWLELLAGDPAGFARDLLTRLSARLGSAQFFATHRAADFHVWARADDGKLVRGFGYRGAEGKVAWDEGEPTPVETTLGPFSADDPPDEETVMAIADAWSVNPSQVDRVLDEPGLGTLCDPPAAG